MNILCKIFNFILNIFEQVLNIIVSALVMLGGAVVDVLSGVADAVGDALGLSGGSVLWLALGGLALFLFVKKDDKKDKGSSNQQVETYSV